MIRDPIYLCVGHDLTAYLPYMYLKWETIFSLVLVIISLPNINGKLFSGWDWCCSEQNSTISSPDWKVPHSDHPTGYKNSGWIKLAQWWSKYLLYLDWYLVFNFFYFHRKHMPWSFSLVITIKYHCNSYLITLLLFDLTNIFLKSSLIFHVQYTLNITKYMESEFVY